MKHSFETNDERNIFEKVRQLAPDNEYEITNYLKAWKENWESLVADYPNALATKTEVYNFEKNVAIATINDTIAAHSKSEQLKKLVMDDIGAEYIPLYYRDDEDNFHLSFELYFDENYDIMAWEIPKHEYDRDALGHHFNDLDEALDKSLSIIKSHEIYKADKAEYEAEMESEKKKSSKRPKP